MADKRINELEEALSLTASDLFVLQQANTAKKLSGQTMTNFLLALANGHGGISGITKTGSAGTDPVVDTYTITFADLTTATFTVTNGLKGDTGATGPQGPKGDDATITSTSITYQAWTSGTEYPTGTWVDNPPSVAQGAYLWTRTIVNYSDGTTTTAYSVARMGVDGSGAVSTVNGVSPDGSGNVQLTAGDVGALPVNYQAPVTSVNGKTGTVNLNAGNVGAVAGFSTSATISSPGWYRVLSHNGGIPNGGIIKFKIGRNQNGECHEIDLLVPNGYTFANEVSVAGTNFGVTKVRVMSNGNNVYVDVYYALSSSSKLSVSFEPFGTITQSNITVAALQSVSDSPSGETVAATYEFVKDSTEFTLINTSLSIPAQTFTDVATIPIPAGRKTIMATFNLRPNNAIGKMLIVFGTYVSSIVNVGSQDYQCVVMLSSINDETEIPVRCYPYDSSNVTLLSGSIYYKFI